MKQTSETTFEPDWLSLREPADMAARDAGLLVKAAQSVAVGGVVLDLGVGTGSTARAFERAGFADFNWRFVDDDPGLLKAAQASFPQADCVLANLARVEALPMEGVSLITASALLDLMSEAWLETFFARALAYRLPIYAALNYDGVMQWSPSGIRDREVTQAFNIHQRTDKGTGSAMGPTAVARLAQMAHAAGWIVSIAESPWRLGKEQASLQDALVTGIAEAAHEAGAEGAMAWGDERREKASQTTCLIGHQDVLVTPGGRGA